MIATLKLQLHALLALLILPGLGQAQGTAFTYNGRLLLDGTPVSAPYEMQFTLYDAISGGTIVGGPFTRIQVDVVNGLFSTLIDFGANVFTGPPRWLDIAVRPGGAGALTILAPRQEVTSSPYAIRAQTAGSVAAGTVVADQLNTGGVAPIPGQFLSYDGGNLTWRTPGAGAASVWLTNGTAAYYNVGNVGIGTITPAHRLSLSGGPSWTEQGWVGSVELPNGSALGWQANAAGQRFGMGHANTGFYLFRTASNPGTTTSPALYDFVVNDEGNVGIGVNAPTAGYKLEVNGSTLLRTANGSAQLGSPNREMNRSMTPNAGNRADLRFDGSVLKLVASTGVVPPSAANGIAITTAGNVGIGTTAPIAKLHAETSLASTAAMYGKATGAGAIGVQGDGASAGVYGRATSPAGAGVVGQGTSGPAVHADGNATQARDKGGFVKATAYIDPFLPAAQYVVRCYNSQQAGSAASTAPCGITVSRLAPGYYAIKFGFNIEDRFISLTLRNSTAVTAQIINVAGDEVEIFVNDGSDHGRQVDSRFYIIVY
ncbi:MAG: hypothetical protein IPK15_20615 [Verrucomicrobia bacterium]|nr:hypothetical protein [Verrucomicrobiota bacterium]